MAMWNVKTFKKKIVVYCFNNGLTNKNEDKQQCKD